MFYCEKCAKENGWPFYVFMAMSYGPCEMCGTTSSCADVPSSSLPPSSKPQEPEKSLVTSKAKKPRKKTSKKKPEIRKKKFKVQTGPTKTKVKIDWGKKTFKHSGPGIEINLPWPEFKFRKDKKPGSSLKITDMIEPGVEFWDEYSKKWVVLPTRSICLGTTVGHVLEIDPKTKYRYPKNFKENAAFWKRLFPTEASLAKYK